MAALSQLKKKPPIFSGRLNVIILDTFSRYLMADLEDYFAADAEEAAMIHALLVWQIEREEEKREADEKPTAVGCGAAMSISLFVVFTSNDAIITSSSRLFAGRSCGSAARFADQTGVVTCWKCAFAEGLVEQNELNYAETVRLLRESFVASGLIE